jgi:Holliday junction DNA helicase RuvA
MIAHLQGKLVEKHQLKSLSTAEVLDIRTYHCIHTHYYQKTDFIKLFTHLQVKEDSHTLFGFIEKSEREIFRLLISVSGIGASSARTMFSSLEPKQIIEAILR